MKKVICIEDAFRYRPFLDVSVSQNPSFLTARSFTPYKGSQTLTSRNASQRLKGEYGDRITTVERDPFTWEAYSEVEQQGLLDNVPTVGFEQGEVADTLPATSA